MEAFYSQWLLKEQNLLMDLLTVPHDHPDLHIPLISRVLSHYAEYDAHKSPLSHRVIFQVFSAYWFTPFEQSFLWLAGMKPSKIFCFVLSDHINDDQRMLIQQLRQETAERAMELSEGKSIVEDAMTVLMTLAAMHGHVRNGEARGDAVLRVSEMMRAVFDGAERLRRHVMTRIIEILGTAPAVQFLASLANQSLWMRVIPCYDYE